MSFRPNKVSGDLPACRQAGVYLNPNEISRQARDDDYVKQNCFSGLLQNRFFMRSVNYCLIDNGCFAFARPKGCLTGRKDLLRSVLCSAALVN